MRTLIETELDPDQSEYWFSKKKQKFLHNIDSFYYSVFLANDFSRTSVDEDVRRFRRFMDSVYMDCIGDLAHPIRVPGCNDKLIIVKGSVGGQYIYHIRCTDEYDIFITNTTRNDETNQIHVQIRAQALWYYGAHKAFEKSYAAVKGLCEKYHFSITKVQENRLDYCWHTNYIQTPEVYFRNDRVHAMKVSHMNDVFTHSVSVRDGSELDYVAIGNRMSGKVFVRIYLKTKEVCQMHYKPFFFMFWLFNNLISRYDYEILNETYKSGDGKTCWSNIDLCRLKWYMEFGSDAENKRLCAELVNAKNLNRDKISKLADYLTPQVTKILNVEFEVKHRASKSFTLISLKDNEKYAEAKRIYDILDNHRLITDYLTHEQLRFVLPGDDTNKSRAPYTEFWKTLRSAKMVDVKKNKHDIKLVRDYTRRMNKDLMKTRMYNSIVRYSMYEKGINEDAVEDDLLLPLMYLNDNDIYRMTNKKAKDMLKANEDEFLNIVQTNPKRKIQVIDADTGEVLFDGS